MDDLNLSISQHLKSGQYYEDAHKWYANRFVFLVTERSYILLLLAVFAFSLIVLAYFYSQTKPADNSIAYMVNIPDVTKQYAVINQIGDMSESPQITVTRYMLGKYVTKRESYKFSNIADKVSFVRNTSSSEEFQKYSNYISINNPSSPIMLYQDTSNREVQINRVELLNSEDQLQHANVYFTSSLNSDAKKVSSDDLLATISFQINNINDAIEKKEDQLKFLVVDYSVNKNNKN